MKAKFTAEQILDLLKDIPSTPAQLDDFALVEVKPGTTARFSFRDSTEFFYMVSQNALTLFCNNDYYGIAQVVLDYAGPRLRTFLVRGDAVVLNNGSGLKIYPVGKVSDAVYEDDWGYLPRLRAHFVEQYGSLLKSMPESFEANYGKLIMTMGDHDLKLIDGQLTFVDSEV